MARAISDDVKAKFFAAIDAGKKVEAAAVEVGIAVSTGFRLMQEKAETQETTTGGGADAGAAISTLAPTLASHDTVVEALKMMTERLQAIEARCSALEVWRVKVDEGFKAAKSLLPSLKFGK